jgi:hypothetical protein
MAKEGKIASRSLAWIFHYDAAGTRGGKEVNEEAQALTVYLKRPLLQQEEENEVLENSFDGGAGPCSGDDCRLAGSGGKAAGSHRAQ